MTARAAVAAILAAAVLAACGQTNATGGQTNAAGGQTNATGGQTNAAGGQTNATEGTVPVTPSESFRPSPAHVKSPPPPGFADLSDVDPTILQDIRYYTDHNFVGHRIVGYDAPRCLLTTRAAQKLHEVQQAANAKGLSLKVYDCYRPARAVEYFKTWVGQTGAQEMKAEFYPSLAKSRLLSEGWIAAGTSGHSRGSTVDLTLVALPPRSQRPYMPGEPLVACTAPAGQRFPDNTVDMGTGFDCFDNRSHTDASGIPAQAKQERQTLKQLMEHAGFKNFVNEWWHYRLESEPFTGNPFDFPISP